MFDQLVTFLYATDVERSAGFYGETLGLPLVLDQGACRIFRVSGSGFLGICQCGAERPVSPEGIIVTLVCDDVAKRYEELKKGGVSMDGPLRDNPQFNITHFFLEDPDGYKIEIQRFNDPDWPKSG